MITFQNVLDAAIGDRFNDPSFAFVTKTMVARWVNLAVMDIYSSLIQLGASNIFNCTEKTVTVVAGTDTYDLPSGLFQITDARIKDSDTEILPANSIGEFKSGPRSSIYTWADGPSRLATGVFTQTIRISPFPTSGFIMALNGRRTPTPISVPVTAGAETTTYIDLPDALAENLYLRVEKQAYRRDKAAVAEINNEIAMADARAFPLFAGGSNRQASEGTVRSRW